MKSCLVLLLALSLPGRAVANDECSAILRTLLKDTFVSEAALLQAFDPTGPVTVEKVLGDGGKVQLVSTPAGKYVVRFELPEQHVVRESFAIAVARKSPLKTLPNTRLFGAEATAGLREKIIPKNAYNAHEFEKSQRVSVSVFYDAPNAEKQLDALLGGSKFDRNFLVAAGNIHELDFEDLLETIVELWPQASRTEKARFAEDIKSLFPSLKHEQPEFVFSHFRKHATADLLDQLQVQRIKSLPAGLRRQVADSWLLYTALGIRDFHSKNWLLHGNTVLPIDLGYTRAKFLPLNGTGKWQPYRQGPMTPRILKLLLEDASPAMYDYLRSLRAENLQQLAGLTRYELEAGETADILAQIQEILRHQPGATPSKP